MFRRIVVGVDGSPESKDAVVLGAAMAAATGSGLTLLGAYAPFPLLDGDPGDRNSQAASAHRQLSAMRQQFAPSAHITSIADGNSARALLTEARSWHAGLIVIGSSRHAAVGRCAIGKTGRRLLNKMPPAVAIAKRGLHQQAFTLSKIAVGYEGGTQSERALRFADQVAVDSQAELLIATVNKDPTPALLQDETLAPALMHEMCDGAELAAVKIAEGAAARTVAPSSVEGSIGEPGSVLRDLSERVDLMVIGSRRWGLLPRVLLGGVGEALVADCGASLVIASLPADRSTALRETPYADPQATPTSTPAPSERLTQ